MDNPAENNKEEVTDPSLDTIFDQPVEHVDLAEPTQPEVPTEPAYQATPAPEPAVPFEPLPPITPVDPIVSAPVVAPKKSRKGLVATIVILVLLLLAAAGYIVYTAFFQPKAAETSNTTTTAQQATTTTPNAQAIVEKVHTAVKDGLTQTLPAMIITDTTYAPAYKADGASYAVNSSTLGHGLNITPEPTSTVSDLSSSTKVEQVIADSFTTQKGFTKSSQDWQTTYQNDSVICTVSVSSSPVSLNCADKSAYSDLVKTAKPFATAYLASADGKKYGEGILLSEPKITEKASGYSSAAVSMGSTQSPVGGYAGLFYAKDGTWTYWRGTQSVIDCTDYNTHDLQKAFEGDSCYDSSAVNQTSAVKVTL